MNISTLINQLQQLEKEYGNVEVLTSSFDGDRFSISGTSFQEVEDDREFPKSWNMPKGFQYVLINT